MTYTEKKIIKCRNCGKTHEILDGGFPKNLIVQEILDFKAKEVYQSKQIEEFKSLLDHLDSMKQNIELKLKAGDAQIRDHCDEVRNEMQLSIEQAKSKLDEIHQEFMNVIDQHEKQCQKKFKFIQQNKTEYEEMLSRSNELIEKSNQLLKQFRVDETELTTTIDQAHILLSNLEVTNEVLERDMFNEVLLKFEKKLFDSISIGKIIKQKIELYFLKNIENMRELDVEANIEFTNYWSILQPFKLKSFLFL